MREACVDELLRDFPSTSVVLAGDLNQLDDGAVVERTGFVQLVQQPTRGQSIFDRIFVSVLCTILYVLLRLYCAATTKL